MIGHAKLFSDGVVGLVVDKERTQSEVATVGGLSRIDEELAAEAVIHYWDSGLRVHFRTAAQLHGRPEQKYFQGSAVARSMRTPHSPGPNGHRAAGLLR